MKKKFLALLLAVIMVVSLVPAMAFAEEHTNGAGAGKITTYRIGGSNRYATSNRIAEAYLKATDASAYQNIIVACGNNFPDALAGGYLAKVANAPILLYSSSNESAVLSAINTKLAAGGKVYLLGGTGVIPQSFETAVGDKAVRLGGTDRYATNLQILQKAFELSGATNVDVLICNGTGFADSLSASAAGRPILLVDPNQTELTAAQKAYLDQVNASTLFLIGGEGVVSKGLESNLRAAYTVTRLAGLDRYETSAKVARQFASGAKTIALVSGLDFPDGFSGAPLAMANGSAILLVNEGHTAAALDYAKRLNLNKILVLGGTGAVSDAVVNDIVKNTTPEKPAPKKYTVTFDLNGIPGTAPEAQTIVSGGKVIKPTKNLPILENHTLQWFTKDASTGKLSDKWDFNTDTVTEDITLYAQWTRTLKSIIETNEEFPTPTTDLDNPPTNAWVNGQDPDCKVFVRTSDKGDALYLKKTNEQKNSYFTMSDAFTKVNNNYEYEGNGYKATCIMEDGKFVSFVYEDALDDYKFLNGTYTAPAASVTYMAWDASEKQLVEKKTFVYTEVTNATTTLDAGKFYVVNGEVSTAGLVVNGTAANPTTLILADGAKLTATGGAYQAGIAVASDKALVITGQSAGTGTLIANGGARGAGIGGNNGESGGNVVINGGSVNAKGGQFATGIGSGYQGDGGTVTINGGSVTATVTLNGGAGIGAGYNGSNHGTVAFGEGVKFTVMAGDNAGSAVSKTTAEYATDHSAKYVKIEEASIKYMAWDDDQKKLVEKKISDYTEVTDTTTTLDAGKFYVVKGEVSTSGLVVNGTTDNLTTLILADGAKLTATGANSKAGINVASTKALVITGQSGGTGELIVIGGSNGAGIGGDQSTSGGSITINCGTVTATGGAEAAGIGGGYFYGNGGNVTINGGTVIATGYAGIGGGNDGGAHGTVTFGSDNFTVMAGADAGSAVSKTTAEYATDHSAAYAKIEEKRHLQKSHFGQEQQFQ